MVPSTCNKPGGSNAPAHDIRGHKLIPSAASKTFYYDRDVTKEDWVDEGELCQNLGAELNIFLFKFPARNPVSGIFQSSEVTLKAALQSQGMCVKSHNLTGAHKHFV